MQEGSDGRKTDCENSSRLTGVVPAEEGRGMVDNTGDRGGMLLLMWVAEARWVAGLAG